MRLIIILIIILFSTLIRYSTLAYENKILLKINNEIITTVDIFDEISYLKSLNKNIDNLDNEKIFTIARNSLIKYKIKEIALKQIVQKIEIRITASVKGPRPTTNAWNKSGAAVLPPGGTSIK